MHQKQDPENRENGKEIATACSKGSDWEKTFNAIDDWISIINLDSEILRSNRSVEKYFNVTVQQSIGRKCCELVHGTDQAVDGCPITLLQTSRKRECVEIQAQNGRWMSITVDPIFDSKGEITSVVHIVRDITSRILLQKEREALLTDLQQASSKIKALSGLIPICANCKKIRDDQGYWNLIESFIETHSNAEFSHGLCPDCHESLYGKQQWFIRQKAKRGE